MISPLLVSETSSKPLSLTWKLRSLIPFLPTFTCSKRFYRNIFRLVNKPRAAFVLEANFKNVPRTVSDLVSFIIAAILVRSDKISTNFGSLL